MTAIVGFPLGTVYPITNITQACPGVVTLGAVALPNSFAVASGMTVTISNVVGMNQINGNRYIINSFDPVAMTFQLYTLKYGPASTVNFTPYISGGEMNIFSYIPPAGEPPGLMFNNQ